MSKKLKSEVKMYAIISGEDCYQLKCRTLEEFAEEIFVSQVIANDLKNNINGRARFVMMWKSYLEQNAGLTEDEEIYKHIADTMIDRYGYYYQEMGRFMNNRNYKFVAYKLKMRCHYAMKKYRESFQK